MFTFTEQYKNISGFLNILKVVGREETRVHGEDSKGWLMGMQGKVDCDDEGGEKDSASMSPSETVSVIMRMGGH